MREGSVRVRDHSLEWTEAAVSRDEEIYASAFSIGNRITTILEQS